MRNIVIILLLVFVLFGCSSLGTFALENRQNLIKLEYGMTKSEVHSVMGQKTVRSHNNPYRTAMYMSKEGLPIEVFFYWTDRTKSYGVSDNELTPVVFSNGKVVGWGREFWMEFVQKIELRIK